MSPSASRAAIAFSCLGHLYIHLFTAFYFVVVLSLERAWGMPYPELIELWTLGALLVGVGALPAGLLADRLGANRMMVVFFLGIGAASIAAGTADGPGGLLLALAGIGLFASIYHPVGIPWLVRNAGAARGKVLAFNGIFGSLGTALAGITAGALIDLAGWRAAFMVPGAVAVLTGLALVYHLARTGIPDLREGRGEAAGGSRADARRALVVLLVTMFVGGVIYQSTQTALPKLFAGRHGGLAGEGATGIGALVAMVYVAAGLMQLIGGHLADRYPLKRVYLGALALQAPLLWLAAGASGLPLVAVAALMVMANAGALPAENMLLVRHTPARRHGLVFGIKFVLAFGAGPLAVQLVALISARTGGLYWVFALLAGLAAFALAVATRLPAERRVAGPALGT